MIPAYHDARADVALRGPALTIYLFLLHSALDIQEFRPVKQIALARETGFSLSTIERAMALLVERHYLDRAPVHPTETREYKLVYSRAPNDAVSNGEGQALTDSLDSRHSEDPAA